MGRIGAIGAPIVIGASYASIGFTGVFALFTAAMVIGAVGVLVFGVGTKDKTLEQIEVDALGASPSLRHTTVVGVDHTGPGDDLAAVGRIAVDDPPGAAVGNDDTGKSRTGTAVAEPVEVQGERR